MVMILLINNNDNNQKIMIIKIMCIKISYVYDVNSFRILN
jgi:hypothetical protein